MTKFASRSTSLQLAVAAAVLIPMSAFGETPMTARQMLAHAQTQALNVPGDIRKPALEPDRSEKFSGEAVAAPAIGTTIAAPLPVIEPPAPIAPPTALATPIAAPETASPQSRSNTLTAVAPATDTVKALNALVAIPPVAASTAETPAPTPSTPPTAALAPPAVAPAQPTLPAATATETTRIQAVTTTSSSEKPAHAQRQPATATPAVARPARKSVARSSVRSDDAVINTQISRIMRRPEVQSLMSQYGLD